MSVNIPVSAISATFEAGEDKDSSSTTSEEDNRDLEIFDDWIEEERPCKSLFEDKVLPSAVECIKYDKETHGFDVLVVSTKLGLDFLGRARLINRIRKEATPASELANLTGQEPFLLEETYLKPTIEDDPLLQLEAPDSSDSEDDADELAKKVSGPNATARLTARVKSLQKQLSQAKQDLQMMRTMVKGRLELLASDPAQPTDEKPAARDDDTHYFESYAYNDIHAVMIQDTIRTTSYSKFILGNPLIFKDAVVMDVGCGTGILSLFAARAGARKVIAIDASDVVKKAKQIVEDNDMQDVITVIRGKVEDLTELPDGIPYVDVIISEWMGYACIYESMLDSVLVARDKFLRKEEHELGQGLMAPSQCRMLLGLTDASELVRERIRFWDDVHGFKMTAMAEEVYDDAVTDVLGPETLLGEVATIKDIPVQHITIKSLDFVTPFKLVTSRSGELNSFVVYFDTFFTTDGKDLPPDAQVELHKGDWRPGEVIQIGQRRSSETLLTRSKSSETLQLGHRRRESQEPSIPEHPSITGQPISAAPETLSPPNTLDPPPPPPPPAPPAPPISAPMVPPAPTRSASRPALRNRSGSRRSSSAGMLPRPVSFSTGPRSMPTHWKQTVFLLRNPVRVRKGSTVTGTFHCRKSSDNSRELDVEIHYYVDDPSASMMGGSSDGAKPKEAIVQMFKVR